MTNRLRDEIDWQVTTFSGNRQRQHQEFQSLSFRDKLAAIEKMEEVGAFFASRRAASHSTGQMKSEHRRDGESHPRL